MKVKFKKILMGAEALRRLSQTKLKLKLAMQLKQLLMEMDSHLATFEAEKMRLIRELGTVNDKGEIHVPADKVEELQAQINEASDIEIELPDLCITVEELPDTTEITTQDLILLDWLIKNA